MYLNVTHGFQQQSKTSIILTNSKQLIVSMHSQYVVGMCPDVLYITSENIPYNVRKKKLYSHNYFLIFLDLHYTSHLLSPM